MALVRMAMAILVVGCLVHGTFYGVILQRGVGDPSQTGIACVMFAILSVWIVAVPILASAGRVGHWSAWLAVAVAASAGFVLVGMSGEHNKYDTSDGRQYGYLVVSIGVLWGMLCLAGGCLAAAVIGFARARMKL